MCVLIGKIGEGEHKFVTEIPDDFQNVPSLLPLYAFKKTLHYCACIEHEWDNFMKAMS